jgi:hypothetical protein
MASMYSYPVWNGKKILGYYSSMSPIYGKVLVMPTLSTLKQSYDRKLETIYFPMIYRSLDNGVTITTTRTIDVRKKSKRQISILMGDS